MASESWFTILALAGLLFFKRHSINSSNNFAYFQIYFFIFLNHKSCVNVNTRRRLFIVSQDHPASKQELDRVSVLLYLLN